MATKAEIAWRETLARKYPLPEEAREFIFRLGLNQARIAFQPRADLTWFSILEEANKQDGDWPRRVIGQALADFPDDDALKRLSQGDRVAFPDGTSNPWNATPAAKVEKIIGQQSTLVPVSFLEKGVRCAQAVARIKCGNGDFGTGFLVAGNRLVTNHHVLKSENDGREAVAEFNFQRTTDGRAAAAKSFACDVRSFFVTVEADDLTVVGLSDDPLSAFTPIPIERRSIKQYERVNIIQHPGGLEKQLSYFHNVVTFSGDRRLQYLTDTMPGSSGSPVFDKDWNIVGVHHSGGWLQEPGIHGGTYYRNEGIDIGALIDAVPDLAVSPAREK